MTLTSQLPAVLAHNEFLEQAEALKVATSLSQMVHIVLQMGLFLARWLLEDELSRRAKKVSVWGNAEEPPKVVNLKSVCLESIRHMFFRWDVKLNRTVADPRLKVSSYYSTV